MEALTEAQAAQFAVVFDQWRARLTDEEAATIAADVQAVARSTPAALAAADQMAKANNTAWEIAKATLAAGSDSGDAYAFTRHVRDTPEWFRLGAHAALIGYLGGTADTCGHLHPLVRPEPAFASAWRPGKVACALCCGSVLTATPAEDVICDGCGKDTSGLGITTHTLMVGHGLLYYAGACDECAPELQGEEVADAIARREHHGPNRKQRRKRSKRRKH